MRGMRLNDPDTAPKDRWSALEVTRQLLLNLPPDERAQRHVVGLFKDVSRADRAPGGFLYGTASGPDEEARLVPSVVRAIVDSRLSGEATLDGAPPTVRVLGAADVMGLADFDASLVSLDRDALVDRGCLVNVLFTDLSVASFLFHADGMVPWFGASAPLGFVEEYAHLTPVDASTIDWRRLSVEANLAVEDHDSYSQLGLVIAALTATDEELVLL